MNSEKLTVYVLFHETNSGKGDESDGYVEAVYATNSDGVGLGFTLREVPALIEALTKALAAVSSAQEEAKRVR